MNTITFYSYKGGVGRTLAVANVARYLALLGKRVVCADFDFEAPGLHYKFGILRENIRGGTIDLVADFLARGDLGNRIEELAVPIDVGDSRGSVHMLAAGHAPHPEYWSTLGKIDWHRLFFDGPEDDRPPGIELFLEIQAQIKHALAPDYLLIDARTGITEVGGVALSLLADAVVCVLAHNRENLDGARSVMRSVQAAPKLTKDHTIRLLPVLSRIPTKLEPGEEEELLQAVMDFLNEPAEEEAGRLKLERVFVLHSEPRLQVHEALKVPEAGAVEESTLLRDYLELFRDLIPRKDVAGGLAPLLERARKRAFDDPDAAQGELESLALLYPARETAFALLQLYVLRNLSSDRVLQAAQKLYEVTLDPTEPALLSALNEHLTRIDPPNDALLTMAVEVWEAQVPENGKLAALLVDRLDDLTVLERIIDIGLVQAERPEGNLAVALIKAHIRCGDGETASALANELMSVLGKDVSFLEARVAAVVALQDEAVAAALADELAPMRERLAKATWTRLQVAAGHLSGPTPELMQRVEGFLTGLREGKNPSPRVGLELVQELALFGAEGVLIDPLEAMKTHQAQYLARFLARRLKGVLETD